MELTGRMTGSRSLPQAYQNDWENDWGATSQNFLCAPPSFDRRRRPGKGQSDTAQQRSTRA